MFRRLDAIFRQKMASKRRNMFHKNKTQETTEEGISRIGARKSRTLKMEGTESIEFDMDFDASQLFNDTSPQGELCIRQMEEDILVEGWCPRTWDKVSCWPPAQPGHTVVQPCFGELNNIKYDASQNATKLCHGNGTWDRTDYNQCGHLEHSVSGHMDHDSGLEVSTMIYFVGYTASLVALCLAVWIFLYFKDLRCLRNTIHTNLMFTYILADFLWLLNYALQVETSIQADMVACLSLIVLLHYFHLTNFFWMFVEGLYLYMLVVETFTRENIKLRAYVVIGWGSPLVVILVWAVAKKLTTPDIPTKDGCPWVNTDSSDWIYQAPALVVLAVNLVFLVRIMWVLITKLRSANNVETQQYRKATKALLVLIPLLGITYILLIAGPTEGVYANVYGYLRAFLLATQGLTVALFYCFLNTEVQNTVRHHLGRWKEGRQLRKGGTTRRYTYSKDWSPNTRTESIRLYSKHDVGGGHYKKRESTASESTTMTLVGGLGGGAGSNRVSNGSMGPILAVRAPVSPYLEAPMENAV